MSTRRTHSGAEVTHSDVSVSRVFRANFPDAEKSGFRSQALVIPIQALVVRDIEVKPGETPKPGAPRDEEGVYLIENDKARFQKLKTGLLGELSLEVLEGLKGGESLITGPFKALREIKPGDLVKVEKPKAKDGSPS